jgi:uncharacterized protein YeaO (DUF488 family)
MQSTKHDDFPKHSEARAADRLGPTHESGPVSSDIHIRRAYEPRVPQDGRRVLVDRLWPRGLSKHDLQDVVWIRDVAPSASLRKWFGHKPERWTEFRRRYFAELSVNPAVEVLKDIVSAGPVTLIYGAHDKIHNQAAALVEYLGHLAASRRTDR